MKKLTVLCLDSDRDASLEALRELGVLHVESVTPPSSEALDRVRQEYDKVKKTLDMLPENGSSLATRKKEQADLLADARKIVAETEKLTVRRKELKDRIERLDSEMQRVAPLGNFDPAALAVLEDKGVPVRIYTAGVKKPLEVAEGVAVQVLAETKNKRCFAVVGKQQPAPDWDPFRVPDMSLDDMKAGVSEAESELISIESSLARLAKDRNLVVDLLHESESMLDFEQARAGMGVAERICYLRGYCPVDELERVRGAAPEHGWGFLVEEPAPEDKVPTLIRYPRWVKPVKGVFDFIGILPGYKEIDISAVFLIFFSVFFAMLIGDAGYGFLFLLMTLIARVKMKKAPGYPFVLMGLLSVCTIIWGVLTGNYFGIEEKAIGPLAGMKVDWLTNDNNIMGLCFLIGAIHLSIAHIWNAIRIINTPQSLAQFGWVCMTWTMMFAARYFVLSEDMPPVMWGVGGLGLLLIVLFMTPVRKLKAEIINHFMLPLTVVSNFVDVVSYVRLFAVGMASLKVAQSFNNMAMDLGIEKIWTLLPIALILFLGHALNIALCALGILVHAVRLNTLEFSNHIGLQWAGFKYEPFKKKET